VQNTADLLRGDRSSKIKEPSAHGTLQRTQAPGRIPKSDDESSRETLLIMLPGDRSRKVKDPSVHGTQQLIGSLGTTLSLGHRSKGPTQHHRNTELQQRLREQQIQEMASHIQVEFTKSTCGIFKTVTAQYCCKSTTVGG